MKTTITFCLTILIYSLSTAQYISTQMHGDLGKYLSEDRTKSTLGLGMKYHISDKVSIGVNLDFDHISKDVRMPDVIVTKTNGFLLLLNLVTFNWDKPSTYKELEKRYKKYARSTKSVSIPVGILFNKYYNIYAGPIVSYNEVKSMSSEEVTHDSTLFSDMEFDDYKNFGYVLGIEYIMPSSERLEVFAGVHYSKYITSTSRKVKISKQYDSSLYFQLGLRINWRKLINKN